MKSDKKNRIFQQREKSGAREGLHAVGKYKGKTACSKVFNRL